MKRIQQYWFSQAIAEYTSSARTVELSHWMQRLMMSPDLIRRAIKISDDEMVHAHMCFDLAKLAGCKEGLPSERMQLTLQQEFDDLKKSFLLVLVQSYCFGETVAVPLFSAMKKSSSIPEVLKTFDRILDDEPQHAKFGWLTLAWCSENWPMTKEWLQEIVPIALGRMRKAYNNHPEFSPVLNKKELAWGVFPKRNYETILEKTIATTFSKRLEYYNVSV